MTYFRAVKVPFLAGLVLLLTSALSGQPNSPSDPGDVRSVTEWLQSLGERREGSSQENQVLQALSNWFGDRVATQQASFSGLDAEHSFSHRLWFRIPGPRNGEIVVVVPTDGANDRGTAWAVAWADQALREGTPVSLTFLFTGAERARGEAGGLGSRVFLQDFYPVGPVAVLYLDTQGQDDQVRLTTESGSSPSPLWMVQGISVALGGQRMVPRFTGASPSLFRLDLPGRRNALGPWFDRSFPGLLVASGPADPAMVRVLTAFTEALETGVPDAWDRHYLKFDFGPWKAFWDQGTYIWAFLAVWAILVFGYASAGRKRRGSLRVLWVGLWQLPVLLAFGFLALSAGSALTAGVEAARGSPDLWRSLPLVLSAFKLVVAVSLYLLFFLPFRRSPLSRDPDFYGQAALVWLAVTTVVAAAVELSFSFYFLWALVWAAVLVTARWRTLRTLALVAGPLWLFKAAYDILGPNPDTDMVRWILASPLEGNFIITLLFFPFLLQVNAWHLAGHRHQDRNEGLRAGVQLAVWGLTALGLGLAALRMDPMLPIQTPVAPTALDLTTQSSPLWHTEVERSAFLDRTVWSLTFSGTLPPETVEFTLTSPDNLLVYDCSFPVAMEPEGHRARIIVGRQAPLPLSLRLTLPRTTTAELQVRVVLGGASPTQVIARVTLQP
jgi:hypothetical protein